MASLPFNRPQFLEVVYRSEVSGANRFGIGTYKEKTLHRVLKDFFTSDSAQQEVPVDRFVADILSSDGIIEIQTSGFASMRDKLEVFLPDYPVTLVYPIAAESWISVLDPESGAVLKPRKSPKKGKLSDVLPEMVFILPYLTHPHLKIRLVLLRVEEYRVPAKNRRGYERYDRIPTDILDVYEIASLPDVTSMLPALPEDGFTAKELAKVLKLRGRRAGAALKVLLSLGVITRTETYARPYRYRLSEK